MKGKTVSRTVYWLLVLCLVFTLGYLLGTGSGETSLTLQSATPQPELTSETVEREQTSQDESKTTFDSGHRLNINRATQEELEQLPGIGSELAKRILDYRHKHGSFSSIGKLKDVAGIGDKRFDEIKSLITVGG